MAAEAIARRIFVQGVMGTLSLESILELRSLAEDFLARAIDGNFERALLLNNVGVTLRHLGNRNTARDVLLEARAARARVKQFEMELGVIDDNLAAVTDDLAVRDQLFAEAVRRSRDALGPYHPETLRTQIVWATTRSSPQERKEELLSTCQAIDAYHPLLLSVRATCALELGWAAEELGRKTEALPHYRSAAADFGRVGNPLFADLAAGQAARLAGQSNEAFAAFQRIEAGLPGDKLLPWQKALWALAQAQRAELLAGKKDHARAVRAGETAIEALEALDMAGQVQWQAALAQAEVTVGQCLLELGGRARRERGKALLRKARTWYQTAGAGYEARIAALDGWLRR
jgi:tetratricopeptide (TPR) repeat protein